MNATDPLQLINPAFTSKEGYLNWRRDWRYVYKRTSEDIRLVKNLIAAESRVKAQSEVPEVDKQRQEAFDALMGKAIGTVLKPGQTSSDYAHCKMGLLRLRANQLLAARKKSKEMAQELYVKEHGKTA